ncbi:MAG: hypothetical protein LIO68_02480 [Rikenellaceae bacterium]|nr:hypothetical protein [Rikenellaceae bacterium]
MKVNYHHTFILAFLLTALLASCRKRAQPYDSGTGAPVTLGILPKLSGSDMSELKEVRVIIFSTRTFTPYGPKVLVTNEKIDLSREYLTTTYVGYNDIYVIGNEPQDLSGVRSPEELAKIMMYTQSALQSGSFVFYKQLLNVNVRGEKEIYLEGEDSPVESLSIPLQRVMAKLTVNFDLSTEIFNGETATGQYLDIQSMELVQTPKFSYLVPKSYDNTEGFLDARTVALPANSSPQAHRYTGTTGDILLPENLLSQKDSYTYLVVKGKSGNVSHTYRLPIGDAMNPADSKSDKWDITRNRHYILNLKGITGDGETDMAFEAKVGGWDAVDVDIDVPGPSYLFLDKTKIDLKSVRFYTFIHFSSNGPVTVTAPPGFTGNQLKIKGPIYSDDTHTQGKIGFIKGNWNAANDVAYTINIRSGNISKNVTAQMYRTEITDYGTGFLGTWCEANGIANAAAYVDAGDKTGETQYFYPRYYYTATPAEANRGCRNYKDPKVADDHPTRGKGCWRVATIAEMIAQGYMGWTIEQADINPVSYAYLTYPPGITAGNLAHDLKTKEYWYFCVLDVRPPELADFVVSDNDITGIGMADAEYECQKLGTDWRLPTPDETLYIFYNAGTIGIPNNFFSDSYWCKYGGKFRIATVSDPDGSETTADMLNQPHTVRCVKPRW